MKEHSVDRELLKYLVDIYRLNQKAQSVFFNHTRENIAHYSSLLNHRLVEENKSSVRSSAVTGSCDLGTHREHGAQPASEPEQDPHQPIVLLKKGDILETIQGELSKVFGEAYKTIDSYPCRIRCRHPLFFLSIVLYP